MNDWRHLLCRTCWYALFGAGEPQLSRLPGMPASPCCSCGVSTRNGIYVREDPHKLRCQGQGPEHEEPPRVWKTGDRVRMTYDGRTLDAEIELASNNGCSLMLAFEGIVGGSVGLLPVIHEGGQFRDLLHHRVVTLEPRLSP